MLRRIYSLGVFVMVLALVIMLVGCGGGGGPTKPVKAEDGHIYVRNETDRVLFISYFTEKQGKVEETVQGNETKQISPRPLLGGTKVKVRVEAHAVTSVTRPFVDVDLTINGSQTIKVTRVEGTAVYSGLILYEVIQGTPV